MLPIILSKVLDMSRTIFMRVYRLNGFLVSKETVVLCQWESETKIGFYKG